MTWHQRPLGWDFLLNRKQGLLFWVDGYGSLRRLENVISRNILIGALTCPPGAYHEVG